MHKREAKDEGRAGLDVFVERKMKIATPKKKTLEEGGKEIFPTAGETHNTFCVDQRGPAPPI